MAEASLDGWKPLAEVSSAEGVPERTLYNWVKARRLAARKVDGVTLVDPAAVRALVAARAAAKAPAGAGNAAGGGNSMATGTPRGAENDGALAARLFTAFDKGSAPAELVQSEALPPATVLTYWRQWKELREAGGGDRPTLAQRVEALEQRLQGQVQALEDATWGGVITGEVSSLKRTVADVVEHLRAMPLPRREAFTCPCGASGSIATHIRCTNCGRDRTWGFFPPN
jgi:hypothetical protein